MPTAVHTRLRERAGLLAVSGGALLWGTTGVAVSIVHQRTGLSAVVIGWYRVVIAAVTVAVVVRGPGLRRAVAAVRRRPVVLAVTGIGFGAYQALYFVGVQQVGVSVSTLVSLGVAPVALTLGAAVAGRRPPGAAATAVLGLALLGLVLISLRPGAGAGTHPGLGVLASLASGLGYAGTTALSRRLSDEDPLLLVGITSTVASVVLLPLALTIGLGIRHDVVANAWLVYIGIVATVAAYWLFYRGLRSTPSEVAGILTLLEPLAAAVLAAVVLHEALSGWGMVGAALMLAAVASLYARRPVAEVPPPP